MTIAELRRALSDLPPGPIEADAGARIGELLERSWAELDGGDEYAMRDYKLERAEDLTWRPPVLSFTIERHGATVLGSSRAELQTWEIDVVAGTATASEKGYRQLYPRAGAVKMEPIADEIVQAILTQSDHPAVTRDSPTRVRVLPTKIPAIADASSQTADGRRRRLRDALTRRLAESGWTFTSAGGRWTCEQSARAPAAGGAEPGSPPVMNIRIGGFKDFEKAFGTDEALRILRQDLLTAADTVERFIRLGRRVQFGTNRETGEEIITILPHEDGEG